MKASATEFAKSVGRPPLTERPADAVLESVFELPGPTARGPASRPTKQVRRR